MAMPTPNPFIPNKLDLVPPPLPGSEVSRSRTSRNRRFKLTPTL